MAIHNIDPEGNLQWHCPHVGEDAESACGTAHSHHISHEHIQWHGNAQGKPEHRTVSLPPCSACGAQTFLRVAFNSRELKAPNMWLAWTNERAQALVDLQAALKTEQGEAGKAMLSSQIAVLEAIKKNNGMHTPSHTMALRHIEMARQLTASGKTPPGGVL